MNSVTAPSVTVFPEPKEGIVEQEITTQQRGRVKYDGSYWPARFYDPECQATVAPNNPVSVIGISGITLLVMPLNISEEKTETLQKEIIENEEEDNTNQA